MSLTVIVVSASDLPNVEKFGNKSDPIASVEFQGSRKKTEVVKDELNPTWNANLTWDLSGKPLTGSDSIVATVKDWERVGRNRLLGSVTVGLGAIIKSKTHSQEVNPVLLDGNGRPTSAKIKLQIKYAPPKGAGKQGGGGDAPITAETQGELGSAPGGEGDEDGDMDIDVEGGDAGGGGDGGGGGGGIPRMGRKRKKKREELSTKEADFQIRIKIWEARQLAGGNIHPVAKATVCQQTKMTRVKKSTNRPYWNEIFFYNVQKSPAELVDEMVTFQVFNSRKLRSDALLGSFAFDVGTVWDEPNKFLANKWLLLSSPEDTQGGVKGYLLVSVCIIGAGDDAPVFKKADDKCDIESNLLRPAGMQLRCGYFKLKIFHAEDIPQMDPSFFEGVKKIFGVADQQKELVDPYLECKFAGNKLKTDVKYCNDHPDWNQELRVPIKFPSMCERIKLRVRDWDRLSSDDYIGTRFLNVSEISCPGEEDDLEEEINALMENKGNTIGFLPTFGPCFVNFYGSTREFTDLPDQYEDLNKGVGEGVAFRGRVLVSLSTKLGEESDTPVLDIDHKEVVSVQRYLRRRKYRLYGAFLNATMISEVDAPVEFEISIGNYGNKLDTSIDPQPSTTQPTNAVFDGCNYYFLPWSETKPCVIVNSHWEDISFRLDTLNIILKKIDRLEESIANVRNSIKAGLQTTEVAAQLIGMIDSLIADCSVPIPTLDPIKDKFNDLDKKRFEMRQAELTSVVADATKLRENATDVNEALDEVDGYLRQLKEIAIEPQNSMPDVVIWMISGSTRIAYYRIPAYELLYSSRDPDACGRYCAKVQSVFLKEPGAEETKPDEKTPPGYPGSKSDVAIGADKMPGMLRMKLWLGLESEEANWQKEQTDGSLAVFAETYENQISIAGNWTTKLMPRPKFTDASGDIKLPKDKFNVPEGWRWAGDWFVSPELSLLYDADAGQTKFMEDVFECEARNIPGGQWGASSVAYTDVRGDAVTGRDEITCPEGWSWEDDWCLDVNRAVDEEGWEYCVEATLGNYGPVEKTYHLCRRRRWARNRFLSADPKAVEAKKKAALGEGWEYAPLFNMKFHASERKMDMCRRRRWHRKMVAESPGASAVFAMEGSADDDDKGKKDKDKEDEKRHSAPRMFLTFEKSNKYQLRAYVYQARDLVASDSDSYSDPYAYVSFSSRSQKTEVIKTTLCPTWDQTLIFDELDIYGDPNLIAENPPDIVVEVFDHDTFGSPEFLGRAVTKPIVKLEGSDPRVAKLFWLPLYHGDDSAGELLVSFELFLAENTDLPFMPPMRGQLYLVPNGIRPVMQRTGVEILSWGVRNMKKFQLASVTSPSIEFEVGGKVIESKVIKNTKKNPNFDTPLMFLEVMLPKEELYTPPMNLKIRDHRAFGRKPIVGIHVVKSLQEYRCDPTQQAEITELPDNPDPEMVAMAYNAEELLGKGIERIQRKISDSGQSPSVVGTPGSEVSAKETDHVIEMPEETPQDDTASTTSAEKKKKFNLVAFGRKHFKNLKSHKKRKDLLSSDVLEEEIDWWSKYYGSIGDKEKCGSYLEKGYDTIKIFDCPLEKVEPFDNFTDFCNTYDLTRGKTKEDEESSGVGEFKGLFRVYPLPPDLKAPLPPKQFKSLPSSTPMDCIVRVYVIRAIDLQPQDPSGLADPYLKVSLGKTKIKENDSYIPNTLNPMFGRMFEIKASIPVVKDLKIGVMDYDFLSSDDVIGETIIDLENRVLTKYRATCGLQATYNTSGPNVWRDAVTPTQVLQKYCKSNSLPDPVYYGASKLCFDGKMYNLQDFEANKIHNEHEGPAEERLALYALRMLPLVQEHIETRPLYSPMLPNIEQGKLQMWVDVFPIHLGFPSTPFDVQVRQPKSYELRCIIWNTKDVKLDETSITGERMSDIYIKGWLAGQDEKVQTDVHYRSLNGEGNFNWRFVFKFDYIPPEQVLVIQKKDHFWSLDKTEVRVPPTLILQIWDNDKFSPDDFLGTLELNLNGMPSPSKKSSKCTLEKLPENKAGVEVTSVSLFEQKRLNGWWPCISEETGTRELTGKLELEMEIVNEAEALERPAGPARDEPNANPTLEPPNRPETSFLWFTSPWKTLKFIIWNNYKWYIIGFFLVVLLILFIALLLYSIPGATVNKVFGV
ncbi:myoferlin-like isoform X3 [Antedon mediterranea]|uniref:myoferlin-like isoform X3 n=1 Tax=Antedon mediterranea TaxID=105859 RepID=UPI003AF5443C